MIADIKDITDADELESLLKQHTINFNLLNRTEANDWRKQSRSVIKDIIDAIKQNKDKACVILCITQSLLRAAGSIPDDAKLPVYIDEGFIAVDSGEYRAAVPEEISGIQAILKLNKEQPDDLTDSDEYRLPDDLQKLERYSSNPLYDIKADGVKSKLLWIAALDIKAFVGCFSDITLLAACHEDTVQYKAIKASGVKQIALDWGLETEHYSDGSVYVYWVLEKNEWRTFFKSNLSNEQLENIGLAFEQSIMSDGILTVKGISGIGNPLPVKSHGFNDVAENDHFLNLHTQMPTGYFSSFLKEQFNMTDSDIRRAYYHYDCYQAAMRVSLRNSSKDAPRTGNNYFCFGDKATAKYFISKLASSVQIHQEKLTIRKEDELTGSWVIDSLDKYGRKIRSDKRSKNKAEQKARSRDRAKLTELNPNMKRMNDALIYLRDYRRDNPDKRITKAIYQQVAKDFS